MIPLAWTCKNSESIKDTEDIKLNIGAKKANATTQKKIVQLGTGRQRWQ
jgi:hypothetical protein